MKGAEMARIWGAWAKEPDMQAIAAPRVVPPPYAPEPDPVECFFRELRRALEGRVYPDLQAKQEALEPILKAWQADPKRVRQLCGWGWIREALKALPSATQVA
jgi:transposase